MIICYDVISIMHFFKHTVLLARMSVSDFVSILNRNKTEDGEEDVAEERGDILGLIIRCGSSQSCDFSCELAAKKKKTLNPGTWLVRLPSNWNIRDMGLLSVGWKGERGWHRGWVTRRGIRRRFFPSRASCQRRLAMKDAAIGGESLGLLGQSWKWYYLHAICTVAGVLWEGFLNSPYPEGLNVKGSLRWVG